MFTKVFHMGWIASLLVIALAVNSAAVFAQNAESVSPETVVETFYTEYLGFFHASETEPTFPIEGWYRDSTLLTGDMIADLDSFDEPFDPLLCAQNVPTAVLVDDAELNDAEDAAQVVVRTDFANYHAFTVNLVLQDDLWLIDNVDCSPVAQTPEGVVSQFYLIYLSHNAWDGEGERPNFLVDGAYQGVLLLSDDYIAEIAALLDDANGLSHDPLICAQDVPQSVEVVERVVLDWVAEVTVSTSFANHTFTVALEQSDENWLITGIMCGRD